MYLLRKVVLQIAGFTDFRVEIRSHYILSCLLTNRLLAAYFTSQHLASNLHYFIALHLLFSRLFHYSTIYSNLKVILLYQKVKKLPFQ